jgi:hypothetical protein
VYIKPGISDKVGSLRERYTEIYRVYDDFKETMKDERRRGEGEERDERGQ